MVSRFKRLVLEVKPNAECCKINGAWFIYDDNGDQLGIGETPREAWKSAHKFLWSIDE